MRKIILSLFVFLIASQLNAYTDKPVLIHMDKHKQIDTMGFNMPDEIVRNVYQLIVENKIKLYLSPKKEGVITLSALRGLESGAGTTFEKVKDVFFHEFWTSNWKSTTFTAVGISFVSTSKRGEKVSFGYVDLKEAWPYLSKTYVYMNENGCYDLTVAQAIYTRKYNYNVVQFGRKQFEKKHENSFKVKNKAFNGKKELKALVIPRRSKKVRYLIEQQISNELEMGNIIYTNISTFLNNNKEIILNLGGTRFIDPKNMASDVAVTRIEVVEEYSRIGGSDLNTEVRQIQIFVNNQPLDPVDLNTFLSWNIIFNFNSIEDVLREKKFKYKMQELNSVPISENESDWYFIALQNADWSKITYFVESYRKK